MIKVIFREEYDRETKEYTYLACFPSALTKAGYILAFPFRFTDNGEIISGGHEEICLEYFYQQKIIHKNDPFIPKLRSALSRISGFCIFTAMS